MIKARKNARFYKVSKLNGKGERWSYFVPGQNIDSIKLEAEQEHVATDVTPYGWYVVSVELDHNGVFFSAIIDNKEWTCHQPAQGYSFLTMYLGPEYNDANNSYLS